jgi:hypothetical protein
MKNQWELGVDVWQPIRDLKVVTLGCAKIGFLSNETCVLVISCEARPIAYCLLPANCR